MGTEYIEKSREAIKSIPNMKARLKELKGLLEDPECKERKELTREVVQLRIMLENYVNSLKCLSPEVGVILIEHYANGATISDIAYKYGIDYQKVSRIVKMKDASFENDWLRLSVRLYGVDAIGFIFEEPQDTGLKDWENMFDNDLYNMILDIDGEDPEEEEELCE